MHQNLSEKKTRIKFQKKKIKKKSLRNILKEKNNFKDYGLLILMIKHLKINNNYKITKMKENRNYLEQ